MIKIHFDFTDGSELSYLEGKIKGDNFTTCCLDFFTNDQPVDDVIAVRKNGRSISRNKLLENTGEYTSKEIRYSHNIHKLLVGGTFANFFNPTK